MSLLIEKIKRKIGSMYASWIGSTLSFDENLTEKPLITERENVTSPDIIDYDGMGNQGRFPSPINRKDT